MDTFFKQKGKIVGWDDGAFEIDQEEQVPLIGVVMSGGSRVEGILRTDIEVDGLGVTEELITTINKSKHWEELSLIALSGVTFAGFNVVDIEELEESTGIPVMAVTRKEVDMDSFKKALMNLSEFQQRWSAVEKAGEIYEYRSGESPVYYQTASLTTEEAERALEVTSKVASLPEPLRLADMIARAMVKGKS